MKVDTGIILGSGLDAIVSSTLFEKIAIVPYKEIPHFPHTTISFHAGNLIIGNFPHQKP